MGCVLNLFSSTLSKYHLTSRNPTKKVSSVKNYHGKQKMSMRVIKMSNKIVLFCFCLERTTD